MSGQQFNFISTDFDGVYIVEKTSFEDDRGIFVKAYQEELFREFNINANFKESYHSISKKNVLRGMHYQNTPHGQAKLISVIRGEILDVIVNIDSDDVQNYGKVYSTILSNKNNRSLYIPENFAHGFLVLSEEAIVLNNATSVYNNESDLGVHYNSFDFDWPVKDLILSNRDMTLPDFSKVIR